MHVARVHATAGSERRVLQGHRGHISLAERQHASPGHSTVLLRPTDNSQPLTAEHPTARLTPDCSRLSDREQNSCSVD